MDKLNNTVRAIRGLDGEAMERAQGRLDSLTKPHGSLGRLEELARLIAGMTGKANPSFKNKVIFTLAADHGVADEGVSAYPKEVTRQMVLNFLKGGAGINVLARHAGARVVVVDMGVASDIAPDRRLIVKKIGYGTANMAKGAAMSREEAIKSVCAGIDIFEEEFPNGIDIVGTGDMGIANTTPSSAVASVLTGRDVREVTGRGTGIDEDGLKNKIRIIERAIKVNGPDPKDAVDVLSKVGGFEIAGLSGVMLASAARRVPVVIDGFISGAAALAAFCIAPKVRDYMIASHCSVEKGHRIILERMGLEPLFDFNMRLGEGTGAALGIYVAEAAIKILTEMATFKEASVSEKVER